MIKAILKSIALVIGYVIVCSIAGLVLSFVDIDIYNIGAMVKIGYIESFGWLVVIGVCIHWVIDGFKRLIGKE